MSNIDTLLAAALASASDARDAADAAVRATYAAYAAARAAVRDADAAADAAVRATAAYAAARAYTDSLKAHVTEWGEPCEEFDPECCACQAWHVFNAAHNA